MSPLQQKLIDAMLLRGFSQKTQKSYVAAIKHLAAYYHRSPAELTQEHIQAYFLHLVKDKGLSGSSCVVIRSAIRFFYINVLKWKEVSLKTIEVPKRAQRIPELLSRQDVQRLLQACHNFKHKTILCTIYGCGLRLSEAVNLKVKHIDSPRRIIRIEQAKGAKDRQVLLTDTLLLLLRRYWQANKPTIWLFFGNHKDYPLSDSSVQKIFDNAKRRAKINKIGGIHNLRHAYATHQLEAGMPVHQLQKLLGHNDVNTTMRYVHWLPDYQADIHCADLLKDLEVSDE
jgi:site-specific recombinase XerD